MIYLYQFINMQIYHNYTIFNNKGNWVYWNFLYYLYNFSVSLKLSHKIGEYICEIRIC